MKLSKVIEKLQTELKKRGDINVLLEVGYKESFSFTMETFTNGKMIPISKTEGFMDNDGFFWEGETEYAPETKETGFPAVSFDGKNIHLKIEAKVKNNG